MFLIQNNNTNSLNEFTVNNVFPTVKFNITDIRPGHCGRIKVMVPPYSKNSRATSVPIDVNDYDISTLLNHGGINTVVETAQYLVFVASFIVVYHELLVNYAHALMNGIGYISIQKTITDLLKDFANKYGYKSTGKLYEVADAAYKTRHK